MTISADDPVTSVRQLADALGQRLLDADPFLGTSLGLREYDALVPDPSAAAEQGAILIHKSDGQIQSIITQCKR